MELQPDHKKTFETMFKEWLNTHTSNDSALQVLVTSNEFSVVIAKEGDVQSGE